MGGKNATKHIWKSALPDSWWLNKTSCESFEHVWCTLAYGLLPTPWQAPLWRGPIPTKMVFLHTLAWKCLRDMRWYEGSLDVLKPQQTISCKEKRTLPTWPPLQLIQVSRALGYAQQDVPYLTHAPFPDPTSLTSLMDWTPNKNIQKHNHS